MGSVVEINARAGDGATREAFKELARDAIVVLRDVPAIHALKKAITEVAGNLSGPPGVAAVADVLRGGHLQSLEAFSSFYRTMRHLRAARYFSAGFSDLAANLGLPEPLLIDCGYCRMVVPSFYEQARARPDLFHPGEFGKQHPNEISKMLNPDIWGNAHRDLDVRHYNFQVNFWFPLHDLDDDQTLLLFPEVYRREIPQYAKLGNRSDPDSWGLGRALKVPLRFGDTLLFHSQQVHASPSHQGRNRFTCELRIAAATIDDNARLYWRHFWSLGNFQPQATVPLDERAQQFLEPPPETTGLAWSLQGKTAQAVVHRLFRDPEASLAAGYRHRDARILDDAVPLERADWETIIARLDALSPGQDLWLLVARLLLHQKHPDLAATALARVYGRTKSYFWPLEAGRVAAEAGLYEVAETAFGVAELRAQQSDVALDRYTPGMPPARNPHQELQLLPAVARRAAAAFAARARAEKTQAARTTLTFDYRFFWSPALTASFERYDILGVDELFVALPVDVPFHPEEILDDRRGVAIADSPAGLAAQIVNPGAQLPQPRSAMWLKELGEFVFLRYLNGRYLVPKRFFPLNFAAQNFLKLPGVMKLSAQLPADALAAVAAILATDLEQQSQETGRLQGALEEIKKQGGLRGFGKPHMDEDFIQYSFHEDRRAVGAALAAAVGKKPQSLRLVGSETATAALLDSLRQRGHSVEVAHWTFAAAVPADGFGDSILCEIPKSFADWTKFQQLQRASGGRLRALWSLVLPWSLLVEGLSKYDYTVRTLEDLARVYAGTGRTVERLEQFFKIRGKTIVEFGPSNGNLSGDLIAAGAKTVTAIEGRTENVIKLLLAKYVMGWDNYEIVMDNFQTMGAWAERRYDLVHAQGVYYHCQNPLLFLDGLTRMGDAIYISGWVATDVKPVHDWIELEYGGRRYRAKPYVESYHFASGLASTSYTLGNADIQRFLAERGYATKFCDSTFVEDHGFGHEFIHLLACKE